MLREAEIRGMMTDPEYRRRASEKLAWEIQQIRPLIPLRNPGSDVQVVDYLIENGVPLFVRTETGKYSVDKEVLRWVHTYYPDLRCDLIEAYRSKTRLLANYFQKMDDLAVDGAVHASTKPVAARTGRMSVTDPPLQTLPRGRVVRDAFVAREGHALVMADFAGMEMRAMASIAGETNMLAAFNRGEDLHDYTAIQLFGPNFTKPQRTVCKNAGFGKIFGAGVEKFAVTAGISVDDARAFMSRYDELFPGVKTFMENTARDVVVSAGGNRKGRGFVELIDGRRLPVEADKAYTGVNYRIQGSCAIAAKEKIVELGHAGLEEFFRLPVHDEFLFECPIDLRHEVRETIERVMPDRRNFPGVVLEIESDCVSRWGQHYEDDFEAYIETEKKEWQLLDRIAA
jgi:DNA polymerase-1